MTDIQRGEVNIQTLLFTLFNVLSVPLHIYTHNSIGLSTYKYERKKECVHKHEQRNRKQKF